MADEPILCFDGDDAGRRAAYRARRSRVAAGQAGQEPEVRAAAGRAGPGRSRALGRPRGDRGCARRRAPARRHAVDARDRGRLVSTRRSGAPRLRRASPKSPRQSATKPCADTTGRISPPGCVGCSRRRDVADPAARAVGRPGWPTGQAMAPGVGARAAAGFARARLCRHQPAAGRKPAASRSSRRDAAPRGADPAGRAQSSRGSCTTAWRNWPNSSSATPTAESALTIAWRLIGHAAHDARRRDGADRAGRS